MWSQSFVNCTIIHAWKETWLECPPSSPPNFPFNHLHTHTHAHAERNALQIRQPSKLNSLDIFFSFLCLFYFSSLLLLLLFFSSFLSSFLSSFIYWRDFFSTCNISTLLLWLLYIYILQKLYHYSARSLFPLPSFRKFLFPVVFKYIKKKEEKWVKKKTNKKTKIDTLPERLSFVRVCYNQDTRWNETFWRPHADGAFPTEDRTFRECRNVNFFFFF